MTRGVARTAMTLAIVACGACGGTAPPSTKGGGITYRTDVQAVTSVVQAKPHVFIPPFDDCRAPRAGETGSGPGGKTCTHVMISGATEPGKYFPDYASCDVVRTQRPYWPADPNKETAPGDPRLADATFMAELAWAKQQIEARRSAFTPDVAPARKRARSARARDESAPLERKGAR